MKKNSKKLDAFSADLEEYKVATGKMTNEVLASKALDFSIRFSKELKKIAPTPQEIEDEIKSAGYAIRVRGRVLKALGGSYKGKTRRKVRGSVVRNKRAVAVGREIGIRRSSATFLSRSVAKWQRGLNKNIPESKKSFGKAFTRRKSSQIGETKGTFTRKKDVVAVRSSTFALGKVNRRRGNLSEKVKRQVSSDMKQFLAKRNAREFAKNIKKVY